MLSSACNTAHIVLLMLFVVGGVWCCWFCFVVVEARGGSVVRRLRELGVRARRRGGGGGVRGGWLHAIPGGNVSVI